METTYVSPNIVPFGGNITYTCKLNHFFEDDLDMQSYSIHCYENGTYTNTPMKKCVHVSRKRLGLN